MTTLKETWAQFHARMQPKDGDEFLDDRGNVWTWYISHGRYLCYGKFFSMESALTELFTCPLTPIFKPKKRTVELWVRKDWEPNNKGRNLTDFLFGYGGGWSSNIHNIDQPMQKVRITIEEIEG